MKNWFNVIAKIVVIFGFVFGEYKLVKWITGLVPAGDWSFLIKILVGVGAVFLSCVIIVMAAALIWILVDMIKDFGRRN